MVNASFLQISEPTPNPMPSERKTIPPETRRPASIKITSPQASQNKDYCRVEAQLIKQENPKSKAKLSIVNSPRS